MVLASSGASGQSFGIASVSAAAIAISNAVANSAGSVALAISGAGAVIGVWLLAAGCATERGPYSPITPADGVAPHQTTHGVTMMDENVRNALLLRRTVATRAPMGQIQARITLQNAYREDIWADARMLRLGRRMAVCDVRLWTETAERIAAQATVTYSLP